MENLTIEEVNEKIKDQMKVVLARVRILEIDEIKTQLLRYERWKHYRAQQRFATRN